MPIRMLSFFRSRLSARRNNSPDPRALARQLLDDMPGIKPGFVQIEGIRHLAAADWPGTRDYDRAVAAFEDELGRLTGQDFAQPPQKPAAAAPTQPSKAELTEIALQIVGQTFAASFDGSEQRIDILTPRARRNVANLLDQGADPAAINACINDAMRTLRASRDR